MSYAPALVANAFLYRAKQTGRKLNHAHVQKLVFFLHAWSLTLDGRSLVSERPEAWQYGPLFSSHWPAVGADKWHIVVTTVIALFSVPTMILLTIIRSSLSMKPEPDAATKNLHTLIGEKLLNLLEKLADKVIAKN